TGQGRPALGQDAGGQPRDPRAGPARRDRDPATLRPGQPRLGDRGADRRPRARGRRRVPPPGPGRGRTPARVLDRDGPPARSGGGTRAMTPIDAYHLPGLGESDLQRWEVREYDGGALRIRFPVLTPATLERVVARLR